MKKVTSIIIGLIFLVSGYSFAWDWKYYQVYTSVKEKKENTIYNQLINNYLSSSYYIDKGTASSPRTLNIEEKNGDITVFVVENGIFNHLDGFTVTQYRGNGNTCRGLSSRNKKRYNNCIGQGWGVNYCCLIYGGKIGPATYFTATYNNKDFASTICNTFRNGKIINAYKDGNSLYTNISAGGVTKKIKIASINPNTGFLKDNNNNIKVKITKGYKNCNYADINKKTNGSTSPVSYRLIYYTRYQHDTLAPKGEIIEAKKFNGTNYDWKNNKNWITTGVKLKIKCIDLPEGNARNSGCKNQYKYIKVSNHLIDKITYSFDDKIGNKDQKYINIKIPIDKNNISFVGNTIILRGKNDLTKNKVYYTTTDKSNYTILADYYNIGLVIKDVGEDCSTYEKKLEFNGNDVIQGKNCLGVSGVKSYKIIVDGNILEDRTYEDYNPNRIRKNEDIKGITKENINFTTLGKHTIKIIAEDFAGHSMSKTWTLNVKPNKPYEPNFRLARLDSNGDIYATYENNDTYKFKIELFDRWGHKLTKKLTNIKLFKGGSYIDKDIYDNNFQDDGNAVEIISKDLNTPGEVTFSLRSYVPGTISKYHFYMKEFDTHYINKSNEWSFEKEFNTFKFKQPIILTGFVVTDTGGNIIKAEDTSPNIWYHACLDIKTYGLEDSNYSYEIGNIENSFKAEPEDLYKIDGMKNITGRSGKGDGKLCLDFKYDVIGGKKLNKAFYIKFDPYVKYTKGSKIGKYHAGKNQQPIYYGKDKDKKFKVSIIGFKNINTNKAYLIGQGKKGFNIESYKLKSQIRKNVYTVFRSNQADKLENGILIKEGNQKISNINLNGVKVLIVRNGNLIIDKNITKRIDIAVVSDDIAYATNNNYFDKGNIIVTPNVRFINALLYTDRSLLAGGNDGNILNANDGNRALLLKNQLLIYGTLISNNTLGGSLLGNDNKYTLPGGKLTSNFDRAYLFDIAFFRIGANGYDSLPNKKYNEGKDDYLIIKYNPDIRTHPSLLLK